MDHVVDVDQVRAWASEAGEVALRYFNNVTATRKADNTYVTRADREIEALLAARIWAAYPGHGLIAEEGARASGAEYLWAVDPLDGTRAFVQGLPGWGISIGVLCHGQPCWGLFYMPLLGDWTHTQGEGGVLWNGRDLRGAVRGEWDDQSYLASSSSVHSDYQIDVKRLRALGSIGANIVYTARGSALGALLHKAHIWDLAAGAAILARAGAELRYLSGREIDWAELVDGRRISEPILAAHPDLIPRLQTLIQKRR